MLDSWFTGPHAEVHALWSAAAGTVAASFFGVVAFVADIRGRRARHRLARVAQARAVWFAEPEPAVAINPHGLYVSATVEVHNDSTEVITDVVVIAKVDFTDENGRTWTARAAQKSRARLGPGEAWAAMLGTRAPQWVEPGPVDRWTWTVGMAFRDAANVTWARDKHHHLAPAKRRRGGPSSRT